MSKFWILVADSSHARFFTADTASAAMVEIEDLTHPESRQHAGDIASDLPGKQHDGNASGHHRVDTTSDPHKEEVIHFAREVASHLREKLMSNELSHLVIVAEPSFLGALRNELDAQVKKVVTLEVDKNLTKHSLEDIRAHLPMNLPI